MVTAETKDSDVPSSAFKFVLERPVTPVRKTIGNVETPLNNVSHRRIKSGGRSPRRAMKITQASSRSSSPPMVKASQYEPSFTSQENVLNVENMVIHSGVATKYINVINEYNALGTGHDMELPRIVLAGDRSSGKSSLRENLIGTPVPIMAGHVARFPIEFKMVRDVYRYEIKFRIIPSGMLTNLNSGKLQDFNGKEAFTRPLTQVEFMEVLREVSIILDVPPSSDDEPVAAKLEMKSMISHHCLQIEICGPNFTPLSIFEIPGLCHSSDDSQEIGLAVEVRNIVEEFAKDKRNIIVAVVAASQQPIKPKILQIAEKFDPSGERTLGVLTKCDCIAGGESDSVQSVLRVARNTQFPLKHGWYMVKNRSSIEKMVGISLEVGRCMESTLFSGVPWHPLTSRLKEERMGINALRQALSQAMVYQIHAEFPRLIKIIRDQLEVKKSELQAVKEDDCKSPRSYLRTIVDEYKSRAIEPLINESIKGSKIYEEHLAVQLESCIQTLSDDLSSKGTVRAFHSASDQGDFTSAIAASSRCAGELADELNIYTWINERYQRTIEDKIPGCIPQSLIIELFKEQMGPWAGLRETCTATMSQTFQKFVLEHLQLLRDKDKVLQDQCEKLVLKSLQVKMNELREECLTRSKYQPSQLLQHEVDKRVFNKDVREARLKRLKAVTAWLDSPFGLSKTEKLEEYLDCDQHIVFQLHDILKALYNIAVRDYISWIKMSFLGVDFIKETMDVCNNELFDVLSDDEIRALFKPTPDNGRRISHLENLIWRHQSLLTDIEGLMETDLSAPLKELKI